MLTHKEMFVHPKCFDKIMKQWKKSLFIWLIKISKNYETPKNASLDCFALKLSLSTTAVEQKNF